MEIDVVTITSPVHVDQVWDTLTDSQKFSLWVAASGLHFYTTVPNDVKDTMIDRYKEVLA